MKLRSIALITMAVASIGLVGCASLTQQCSAKTAYQDGMDDGMTPGTDMNPNYAEACLKKNQAALNAQYQQGYNAGLPKRAEVAKQTRQLLNNSRN